MKKNIFGIALLLLCSGIQAQDISYDLASVPEEVKKNAHVIKMYEDILFEVTDINRALMKIHQVYTVLDEKGKDKLNFVEGTSSFILLGDVNIRVLDEHGKQLFRYKKKDLSSIAYGDGLIDDGKTYYLTIPVSSYPVTVEYQYELRYKGTLIYPSYHTALPEEGILNSTFTARFPKEFGLRYKEKNISLKPVITEDGKYQLYKWSVKNIAPVDYEANTVSGGDAYPGIVLAPNRFKMDDYEGDMSSWKSFGKWYASLKKGIDVLPENKKAFFRNLVKDIGDDREKVKMIYDYLQKNFRYVSIQLGIGGFKPFPAVFTDDKKYGDCKGLSNYMQAALDAVDIKSYQALINREPNGLPVDPDFPLNKFNHVILFVPLKNDSIWLECTSKTLDFGMLDISTENRNALLITNDGGVLIPTPKTRPDENTISVHTSIELAETGEGKCTAVFATSGEYKEMINEVINNKEDDQKRFIVYYWGFKQPDVFSFQKRNEPDAPLVQLDMQIEKVPEFIAGNKMFLTPRLYKMWSGKLPLYEKRKHDFYFSFPLLKIDTTVIHLPAGCSVEALPKEKSLSCPYASYTTQYWYDEQKKAVYSSARLMLSRHNIPAADYAAVKKFFDDVLMDDTQRIVIKKE